MTEIAEAKKAADAERSIFILDSLASNEPSENAPAACESL
jgi:hypothetical protein